MAGSVNGPSRRAVVLAAVVGAVMLVTGALAGITVAVGDIGRDLGATQSELQWIVDAYAVVLAALLLPAGVLGDRFGRRKVLLAGLVVFSAACVVSAVADTPAALILGRVLMGVGAALVFPATLSTITATFPDEERSRGVAIWVAAASVGAIIGLLVTGLLLEHYWWGSTLAVTGAIGAVVLVIAWRGVPDSKDPDSANLDPVGSLLSVLAVGGLVLGIIEGPSKGWSDGVTLGGLIVGVIGLTGFVAWERRTSTPLIDVRLFLDRTLAASSLSMTIVFAMNFGMLFVGVQYLGIVRGYGPLEVGLALMPFAVGLLPLSLVAPTLTRRVGLGPVMGVGLLLVAMGLAVLAVMSAASPYWQFGLGLALLGAGIGINVPPATEAIVGSMRRGQQGVASAVNDVARELGAAFGIAIVGSAFNVGYRSEIDQMVGRAPPEIIDALRDSPAAAAPIAEQVGPQGQALLRFVEGAFMGGWQLAFWIAAGVSLLAAVFAVAWTPSARARRELADAGVDHPVVAVADQGPSHDGGGP